MKTLPKNDVTTAEDISLVSVDMGNCISQSARKMVSEELSWVNFPMFRDLGFFGVNAETNTMCNILQQEANSPNAPVIQWNRIVPS